MTKVIIILFVIYLILYFIINYNKNNTKDTPLEEKEKYRFPIVDGNPKILKSIYNTEYSIEDAYIDTYKNGTAIKVILLKNDEIIGDISSEDVSNVLKLGIKTTKVYVENKLGNEGNMEYSGEIFGEIVRR